MQNHPVIDEWLLADRIRERREDARRPGVRRPEQGRQLASRGVRFRLARWLSRSVLHADPCSEVPGAAA